jgi:hypothetical protein
VNANVPVQLNGYQVNLGQAASEIFQFEMRFVGMRTFKPKDQQEVQSKEQDLAKGPKNE